MLGHIAYVLPEDVNRLITDEAQVSSDEKPQNIWCKFVYQLFASIQFNLGYLFYYSLCVYPLQAVNLAVLSNKRKYADLYLHLMIGRDRNAFVLGRVLFVVVVEIEREKEHRTRWEDKVDEWKRLMRRMAEEQFR